MQNFFMELQLQQGSQEWLEARKCHITATEVAHLATGFTSLYTLVQEKRGLLPPKDLSKVPAVSEGSYKEPLIRAAVEKRYPQLLAEDELCLPTPCVESLEDPFYMASLDGFSKKGNLIVEIKNVFSKSQQNWEALKKYGLKAPYQLPYGYYWQVQWQLYVTKAKAALLVFHHSESPTEIDPKGLLIFTIKPDVNAQAKLVKIAEEVKDILINNKTVEPQKGDTVIVEPTQDVTKLIDIYRQSEKSYLELTEKLNELKSVRSQIIDQLSEQLLTESQTRISNDQFTLTRSEREGSVDWEALVADGIISSEVLAKYRKKSSFTTRLTLK